MKTSTIRLLTAALLLAAAAALWPARAPGRQARAPVARKFDEFSLGRGGPAWQQWMSHEERAKELKLRFGRYAAELRKAGAQPYAITYGPRVVEWEIYNRSIAGMRAGALWEYLTPLGFDWRRINTVNGGFREEAATELWVVPPGAQPPCPTPTVRPEDVAYCPSVSVRGAYFVPDPQGPVVFKAALSVNNSKVQPAFSWSVSRGKIVGGEGTDAISVELPAGTSGEVVARVDVRGYSLECPAESSAATARTTVGVSHYKFDEFGDIRIGDTKARLDNLAVTLQENPAFQVHLVVYGARLGPRGQAERRGDSMAEYLWNTRGIERERVIAVDGGHRDELSGELWLSLKGTPAPPKRPTVDESFVRRTGGPR